MKNVNPISRHQHAQFSVKLTVSFVVSANRTVFDAEGLPSTPLLSSTNSRRVWGLFLSAESYRKKHTKFKEHKYRMCGVESRQACTVPHTVTITSTMNKGTQNLSAIANQYINAQRPNCYLSHVKDAQKYVTRTKVIPRIVRRPWHTYLALFEETAN